MLDGVVRCVGAAHGVAIPNRRPREKAGIKSAAAAPSIRKLY